jgi:hypothetical protein
MSSTTFCIAAKRLNVYFGMKMAKNPFLQYFSGYGRCTVGLNESITSAVWSHYYKLQNEPSFALIRWGLKDLFHSIPIYMVSLYF